jgi:two-component system, cell cycle response regulator
MLTEPPPEFLLASPDAALLTILEPVLQALGSRVEIALTSEAALRAMTANDAPALALVDARLTGSESASDITELLVAVRTQTSRRLSLVLIADEVGEREAGLLAAGLIEDVAPRAMDAAWWRLRIQMALKGRSRVQELEVLRESSRHNLQMDHLTGIYNRETLMAVLFRETDRVQRMKSSLATILFDIDDFGHWNSRLGADACDDLLRQVVMRASRILRSYDVFGRPGKDEFLLALPGCTRAHAAMMAERLRGIFSAPFEVEGKVIRLSACFGIADSLGRSPVVVLREAELALAHARMTGPETIHWFDDPEPVAFDLIPARLVAAGNGESGLEADSIDE